MWDDHWLAARTAFEVLVSTGSVWISFRARLYTWIHCSKGRSRFGIRSSFLFVLVSWRSFFCFLEFYWIRYILQFFFPGFIWSLNFPSFFLLFIKYIVYVWIHIWRWDHWVWFCLIKGIDDKSIWLVEFLGFRFDL